MTLSPPTAVYAFAAGALAVTAWLPLPATPEGMNVRLPLAIYEQLASRARGRSDIGGQPLRRTVIPRRCSLL